MLPYLPSYLVSLSSLHYRASFQVSGIRPALGRRGKDFCSSLSSLRTCSSNHSQFFLHFLSSLLLFILGALGALILLVSHLSPYLSPLFSPSSMLISILIAILWTGCFGENGFVGLSCFSLLAFLYANLLASGRNLLPVAFPCPRSRPYATLLAFLLISNVSPYPLHTAMLLTESSAT